MDVQKYIYLRNSSLGMALQMKLKVSDKPLKCIALGHFLGQDVVITGAGEYGEEEALLRWRRDQGGVSELLLWNLFGWE